MTDELRFDGQVAIVTGAGNGLGKSHALELARRGAKVVVNDLGGDIHGDGSKSSAAADEVVEQIKAAGGAAAANYESVENGQAIVDTAVEAFGTVDIVVNNAGILRDISFHKMTEKDWKLIQDVHLNGSFAVTHAAWPILREKGYGRVIFTTSAAGLYGNFGQANYSSAKLGLLGLANTLAIEGRKHNVHVNTIAPIAGSRLTETVMPADLLEQLKPEYVSPLVSWLCHADCETTGSVFEVGAGFFGKLRWQRTTGGVLNKDRLSAEQLAARWASIEDFDKSDTPADINAALGSVMQAVNNPPLGGNEFIDLDTAFAGELVLDSSYDEHDVALYGLGIGAAADPLNDSDRKYVFEMDPRFTVFPTYGVMPQMGAMLGAAKTGELDLPGMRFGMDRLLHGEQFTEIKRPLPSNAKLTHTFKLKEVWDKNPHALATFAVRSTDETGEEIIYNEFTAFLRGVGGWGGERGPSGDDVNAPPERKPDAVISETTSPNQTLLYRLSGDWNPLHADPAFAKAMGFDKPILHGLCTFGYCGRHVIQAFADNDGRYFKNIKVRFADSVYPGETLETRMWKDSSTSGGTRIVFETWATDRDTCVIKNAAIELYAEVPADKPKSGGDGQTAGETETVSTEPGARDVVAMLGAYVTEHPELAGEIGKVYQWNVTDPDMAFVLDLKSESGSVHEGSTDADTTITIAEDDLMALMRGESDAQSMYFAGKLQIGGDIMASQKLQFLADMDPKDVAAALDTAAANPPSPAQDEAPKAAKSEREPVAPSVFGKLAERLDADKQSVNGVAGHVLQFNVADPDATWTLDCSGDAPTLTEGESDQADAVFGIADADLEKWVKGEAAIRDLHQRGQLRVDGDIRLAREIGFMQGLV